MDRYEELRAYAQGGRAGALPQGLALVLGRGLPAWMEAWHRHAPSRPAPAPVAAARSGPRDGLPAEVALVLADMALQAIRG